MNKTSSEKEIMQQMFDIGAKHIINKGYYPLTGDGNSSYTNDECLCVKGLLQKSGYEVEIAIMRPVCSKRVIKYYSNILALGNVLECLYEGWEGADSLERFQIRSNTEVWNKDSQIHSLRMIANYFGLEFNLNKKIDKDLNRVNNIINKEVEVA